MPTPERQAALDQLRRIEREGAYVGFFSERERRELDARTRRQTTDLVAGVTRHRRWLDFLVDTFYRGDRELDPNLRDVLRLGLYELLLSETPPHAALNEAVDLAKQRAGRRTGGLANGLLRNALRQRGSLPQPDTGDQAGDLATLHSYPTWIVRRWLGRLGQTDTKALLRQGNERPTYGLRANGLKTTLEALRQRLDELGADHEPSPYLDDFVRLTSVQPVAEAGLLKDGLCAVQDEAAGLVVRLLDPQPGETVLDLAAAPGGKAIYAAERMQNDGRLLARDVHEARLKLVAEAAQRHGLTVVETQVEDALRASADAETADRVLLDAPCSGLGVLAKRADLRWRRSPEELRQLADLQDRLLDAAAARVRPGGLLVYATCSTEPDENEGRVAAFLARHDSFALETAEGFVPDLMITAQGFYVALPHRHGTDGAFGARLRRRS